MKIQLVIYQAGRRVRFSLRQTRKAISAYRAAVSLYVEGREGFETMPILYPVIRRG